MPATHLPNYNLLRAMMQDERFAKVWNALVPASTIAFQLHDHGVRVLHPTKGWRWVGKKRFAVRGVM